MIASYKKHLLEFVRPSGTSRGILRTKESWFYALHEKGDLKGIGECSIIKGLSPDQPRQIEDFFIRKVEDSGRTKRSMTLENYDVPSNLPAVRFAIETAYRGLTMTSPFILYDTPFVRGAGGIPINGLIWMGSRAFMASQIKQKLKEGYSCLKLKIGAIDFDEELNLLKHIRQHFASTDVELRVDANGAFHPKNALEKLKRLSAFDLHSIEQPIQQGQIEAMAELCAASPLSIALDEELIGVTELHAMDILLETINPQFIILKPSLLGGIASAESWISVAESKGIGWWITSALESNVGLNAIAQWTASLNTNMPQGLGTGQLFTNNIGSPLEIRDSKLYYNPGLEWQFK